MAIKRVKIVNLNEQMYGFYGSVYGLVCHARNLTRFYRATLASADISCRVSICLSVRPSVCHKSVFY